MVATSSAQLPISAEPIASKLLSGDEPNFMDTNVDLMPLMEHNDSSNSTTAYRSRRDRNNLASQKSRASRKQKFEQMKEELGTLESKNAKLRAEMVRLERMAGEWKGRLITLMANR